MKIAIAPTTVSNYQPLVEWLKEKFEVKLNLTGERLADDELINFIGDAEYVIIGVEKLNDYVVEKIADKNVLKWGVGLDNIDFNACSKYNLDIHCMSGLNAEAVAELTIGYMILLLRQQPISQKAIQMGGWNKLVGKQIYDAKIGILGYGNVGKIVYRKLMGFMGEYDEISDNVFINDIEDGSVNHYNYMEVEEIFKQCDVVTIHIDNNDGSNNNFVGDKFLSMMKNGTCLINTARGTVLDYNALERHLPRLGGVAIDVFPNEPTVPDFLRFSGNVILSSHMGGNSETALENGANFIKQRIEYLGGYSED